MRIATFSLFALLALGSFHGCGGKPVDEGDPASLMADAEDEIKSDHYQVAIDKLKVIKNKFPYSKYAIDAQLRLADVYFMQESYPEAAGSYEAFRDLHPKHERVAYAMFRIGKSYFNDIPDPVARDLTPATKALNAYEDFLKRFPDSPDAPEARKDLLQVRQNLAAKELYIGDFYYKRDFYASAQPRYQKVIDLYPDTEAAKEAKTKLEKTVEQLKKQASSSEKK
jgi:outer membrane protein assembly factor BamD